MNILGSTNVLVMLLFVIIFILILVIANREDKN
jgi:hypothetical protein